VAADPRIRASDDDRDRTASLLREHHAAGRLDAEEFNERLDRTFAAKTLGELDELLSDLPAIDLYRLPDAGLPRRRGSTPGSSSAFAAMPARGGVSAWHGGFSPAWRAVWGSWFTITAICVFVWALGGGGYPWFLWLAGPWAALLIGRSISGGHQHGHLHGHQHGHQNGHLHGGSNRTGAQPELPGDQDQLGGAPPG
jgi:hypothetical protein